MSKISLSPTEVLDARHQLKLTAEELARVMCLGSGGAVTVYRWEQGRRVCKGPAAVLLQVLVKCAVYGRKKPREVVRGDGHAEH